MDDKVVINLNSGDDEKTFTLGNGDKVTGVLLSFTNGVYSVQTKGGNLKLNKNDVSKIEDAPTKSEPEKK